MPVEGLRRGALVITGPYPRGPRPGTPDNPFFLDEIISFDDATQDRILDDYCAKRYNETALGPCWDPGGYNHQYDPSDYRQNLSQVVKTIRKLKARGLSITFAYGPDAAPYYDGERWDTARLEADFGEVFRTLNELFDEDDTIQLEWECRGPLDAFCVLAESARRMFPRVRRFQYHNPTGHSAPGTGDEPIPSSFRGEMEEYLWRVFLGWKWNGTAWVADKPRGTGLLLQTTPDPDQFRDDRAAAWEGHRYGVWDFDRRFRGVNSPWGAALMYLDTDGQAKPGVFDSREFLAYCIEQHIATMADSEQWGHDTIAQFPDLFGVTDGWKA